MISGGPRGPVRVMAAAVKEEEKDKDDEEDNAVDTAETEERVRAWAAAQAARGRRVALVTSGGTQVPLEARAVRFLENFSSGRRGAASAERLVRAGYGVCFLHRARSAFPWARALPPHGPALLDALRLTPGPPPGVAAAPAALPALLPALREYQRATEEGALLAIEFTGLVEYLALLRAAARALAPLGTAVRGWGETGGPGVRDGAGAGSWGERGWSPPGGEGMGWSCAKVRGERGWSSPGV